MSRWADAFAAFDEGADTSDTGDKTPHARGGEPSCVSCVDCVTPPQAAASAVAAAEPSSPERNLGDRLVPVSADDLEERAALIEYGAGVPRPWAEGYAALCTMAPPSGFS